MVEPEDKSDTTIMAISESIGKLPTADIEKIHSLLEMELRERDGEDNDQDN